MTDQIVLRLVNNIVQRQVAAERSWARARLRGYAENGTLWLLAALGVFTFFRVTFSWIPLVVFCTELLSVGVVVLWGLLLTAGLGGALGHAFLDLTTMRRLEVRWRVRTALREFPPLLVPEERALVERLSDVLPTVATVSQSPAAADVLTAYGMNHLGSWPLMYRLTAQVRHGQI
jgi:hypothetical protein